SHSKVNFLLRTIILPLLNFQEIQPRSSGGEQAPFGRSQVGKIIVGGISHEVRRLFSFLNFSDRFKKSRPRSDDRFVASIPERKMAEALYGRLQPLPSRRGIHPHLVDDGVGELHRRAFADEVENT